MSLKIVIDHVSGARNGERQELEPRDRVKFGRHPDNDVAFDTHRDLDASAWHAELRRDGDAWLLVDVGSSNGTYIDGRKIARHALIPGQEVEVEFGDGGPRCRLMVGDPDAALIPSTLVGRGGSREIAALRAAAAAKAGTGTGRQTLWKSVVAPVLHPTTKKFVVVQIVLAVTTVAIVATLFFVILGVTSKRRAGHAQGSTLSPEDLAKLKEAQRVELEKMLSAEPGARIAADAENAVYLIAYTDDAGVHRPMCSGFAVGDDVLATNAHCVDQINEKEGRKLAVFAVRNRQPGRRYAIVQKKRHDRYRGPLSPDVGLLRLDAGIEGRVRLAPAAELRALQKGTRMYIYGFPGRVADPDRPDASVGDGMIGRVTTFSGDPDDPDNAYLVQHSAQTSPGSSGSPLFDAKGQVIAINVGQYMEIQEQVEVDAVTGEKRRVSVPAGLAPGLNIAVRIDALGPLLAEWGIGDKGTAPGGRP